MKSEDCEVKLECQEILCAFPHDIPERCQLCTPLVKYVLGRLRDLAVEQREGFNCTTDPSCAHAVPPQGAWWWNDGVI